MKKTDKKEAEEIKRSEKISVVEGSFYGMMEGFGTKYITPYALALGASNFLIALLSTLPNFLGNLNQLTTLKLIKKRSRKSISFYSVLFQALLWIPIILIGILYFFAEKYRSIIPVLLLVFYSILLVIGSIVGPAWNSWMKDLIVKNSGRYFGTRNRIVNLVIVISMAFAGLILSYFSESLLLGFFIIFFIAFTARLISSILLLKQYEPPFTYNDASYFNFKQFLRKMPSNNFGKFVILVSLISLATAIAGPFFAVYMLKDLGFSYIQFTVVSTGAIISMIIFLPRWGGFADDFGNVKVLKLTSLFITIIPLLWFCTIFLKGFPLTFIVIYLFGLELFSGFMWAGFNLSASNFVYDAVSRDRMAFCVAYFNIINSFGAFIGAILGGFLSSKNINLFGLKGFFILFLLSFVIRFFITIFIQTSIREVRNVRDFRLKDHIKNKLKYGKVIVWRFIGFKPIQIDD